MRRIILKLGSIVAGLALIVTTMNVNSTCIFLVHQPELPNGAEKLRKS